DGEQNVSYGIDLCEVKAFLQVHKPRWSPTTAEEFRQRGLRRMHVRWLDAALADLRQALTLMPSLDATWIDLADLYRLRGEPGKALDAIKHALESLPPDRCAIPAAQRAALFADKSQVDDALKSAEQALKIDPKCARAFAVRAELWRRKKDLGKALADADEAVWLDPKAASAYLHRGLIQMERRDFERAAAD